MITDPYLLLAWDNDEINSKPLTAWKGRFKTLAEVFQQFYPVAGGIELVQSKESCSNISIIDLRVTDTAKSVVFECDEDNAQEVLSKTLERLELINSFMAEQESKNLSVVFTCEFAISRFKVQLLPRYRYSQVLSQGYGFSELEAMEAAIATFKLQNK